MAPTTVTQAPPKGYKTYSGNLPPFIALEIGQVVHGQLFNVRIVTKKEKAKQGGRTVEVEKQKTYLDLTLIDGAEFNTGTIKKPNMRSFDAGERVTLPCSGSLFYAVLDAAYEAMGIKKDDFPAEGDEYPEVAWAKLYGRNIWARRENDGIVRKGQFAGNKRSVYTVALSEGTSN